MLNKDLHTYIHTFAVSFQNTEAETSSISKENFTVFQTSSLSAGEVVSALADVSADSEYTETYTS